MTDVKKLPELIDQMCEVIARYDGWKPYDIVEGTWVHKEDDSLDDFRRLMVKRDCFEVYSHDVALLMGIVERIEKGDYGFKMCRKRVEFYIDSTKEVVFDIKKSCRTESLFYAVHDAIVWLNKQHGG